MTEARRPGVIVDTMVISRLLGDRPDRLTLVYRDLIGEAPVVLAFQTVMELAARVHDGDRWIAATAIRLGLPLVSDDRIFHGAPCVQLVTAPSCP